MKKFLLTLFSLLFINSFSFAQSSEITKFEGEELKGLVISGAFDVNVKQGKETKVVVTMLDEVADKVTFELTDDKYVRLSYGSNTTSLLVGKKKRPKAEVTLSELEYLMMTGSATIMGSGVFEAEKFVINIAGSATVTNVSVECDEFSLKVDGTSKVADLKVAVATKAELTTGGSASLDISGSAAQVKCVAGTASSLNMLSFEVPVIDAITSGTAVIKANVTGEATVVTSGMSAFRYTGNGKVIGDGAKKL